MSKIVVAFTIFVVLAAIIDQSLANAIREERNMPFGLEDILALDPAKLLQIGDTERLLDNLGRRKRLLGLGLPDLGGVVNGVTNKVGGLAQGLGLGNLGGRKKRFMENQDFDAANFVDDAQE